MRKGQAEEKDEKKMRGRKRRKRRRGSKILKYESDKLHKGSLF